MKKSKLRTADTPKCLLERNRYQAMDANTNRRTRRAAAAMARKNEKGYLTDSLLMGLV